MYITNIQITYNPYGRKMIIPFYRSINPSFDTGLAESTSTVIQPQAQVPEILQLYA